MAKPRISHHPIMVPLSAIAGATIGYTIYNAMLIFRLIRPTSTSVIQCLVSLGNIDCTDNLQAFTIIFSFSLVIGVLFYALTLKLG